MSDQKTPEIAIEVKNLSKTFRIPLDGGMNLKQRIVNIFRGKKGYREFSPLNGIDFEINKGEFFGIVGRNGSGKSTLLKTIAGIYTPDTGKIKVDGVLVPFIELGVGFNPELTGRENVFLNGALLGFSRTEMADMYEEIVDFAELHEFMEEKLKNYSSGMQVRLAFSIAIRAEGDILLLDEVLAVGDAAFQQKCYDYFEKLKREHRTIILVTHSMDAVKRFCSRALLIEDGKIKVIGSPESIANQYLLDNISSIEQHDTVEAKTNSKVKKLVAKINKKEFERGDKFEIEYEYILKEDIDTILGLTIVKDGRSAAEINSMSVVLENKKDIESKTKLSTPLYSLNPGEYSVNISLMDRKAMTIVDYELNVSRFVIKGNDMSRGGVAHLDGEWSVKP